MRYRATLAYDGTAYQGFQRQAGDTPTVQGVVERAVSAVTAQPVTVIGAGRTDTGVHATGQVIAFDVEWKHGEGALLRAVNASLPDDVALQDMAAAPGFHPRFDALSRLYRYRLYCAEQRQPLLRNRVWHIRPPLHYNAMQSAAEKLIGRHDFAAFGRAPQGENTVRTVFRSDWAVSPEAVWTYTIEADAFLQHMVRRVVWMLVDVGREKWTVEDFEANFRRAQLPDAGSIAPPQGLTLEQVKYRD